MAAGDLTTVETARAWLSLPVDEASNVLLARLIGAVSGAIQTWLGFTVASRSYTRTFSGRDTTRLFLPERNLTAVASVTIDGVAIPTRAPGARGNGFVFDEVSIWLDGERFRRGVQNVVVVYTAGYPTVPPAIEQACLEWLSATKGAQDRDPSLVSRKAGDTEERFDVSAGAAGIAIGATIVPMPASVFAALQPYRRVVPA